MALSKSSLSGCLDFTLFSGLALRSWFFFFLGAFSLARAETPPINRTARAAAAIFWEKRFITTSCEPWTGRPSASENLLSGDRTPGTTFGWPRLGAFLRLTWNTSNLTPRDAATRVQALLRRPCELH